MVSFVRRPDGPAMAVPVSTQSIALNMPRPGWRVNSKYGGLMDLPKTRDLLARQTNSLLLVSHPVGRRDGSAD